MQNTKLITLLKGLNKQEIREFESFLISPVFNTRDMVTKLFREIKLFYPDFDDPSLTKENIYTRLYGNKPYSDETIRTMISRLYALVEEYFSFLYYRKDDFYREYGALSMISRHGFEEIFEKKFNAFSTNNENQKIKEGSWYVNRYQLANLRDDHFFLYPRKPDSEMGLLINRDNAVIDMFLSELTTIYSTMTHDMQLHTGKIYKLPMLEVILKYLQENKEKLDNNYFIALNYNSIQMTLTRDDKYFYETRRLLSKYNKQLSRRFKSSVYTHMTSYVQSKIFKGAQDMLKVRFELFKEAFANEGVYKDDEIKNAELILAVSNGLMLKEIPAVEELVSKYADEVEIYYRQSCKHYCIALIEYYKGNFKNALDNLIKVDYSDWAYKSLVRKLKMMIYFSMGDHEGFYALADSFKHFLDDNKDIEEYNYKVTSNFINFTVKLFKEKEDLQNFDAGYFKKILIETKDVGSKQWLLEQVNKIENDKNV